jgi:hypothetical protein
MSLDICLGIVSSGKSRFGWICGKGEFIPVRHQCAKSTGKVMRWSMWRVTPPSIISRRRQWQSQQSDEQKGVERGKAERER